MMQEEAVTNGREEAAEARDSAFTEEMRVLEALLFASDEVLTPAALKGLLPGQPDVRAIRKMISAINSELQKLRQPFEIVELGGGYQFRTLAYYRAWVGKLLKEKTRRKLSIQALECLAIIAYKQPITKAEIEAIRGVISDGAMKTLMERRMVDIVGRSDKPGRPLMYGTSKEFLEYFGINKLSDLPRIEEFEAMAREKMEELSEEERAMIDAAPDEGDILGEAAGETAVEGEAAGMPVGEPAVQEERQAKEQEFPGAGELEPESVHERSADSGAAPAHDITDVPSEEREQ